MDDRYSLIFLSVYMMAKELCLIFGEGYIRFTKYNADSWLKNEVITKENLYVETRICTYVCRCGLWYICSFITLKIF